MALFIRQDEARTKLQERLAAELTERAKKTAQIDPATSSDSIEDSQYLKNTKQTTSLAWAWVLVVIIAIGAVVGLVFYTQTL